ncbi:NINE protein [Megasphaera sueciensis]|uniref:TM2 domain-containing protein n=1 Tax=Megasphaera sueciensis TaxID=349094 RepID=UPI003D0861A0
MQCKRCGKQISINTNFCPSCGYPTELYTESDLPLESTNVMSTAQTQYVSMTSNKSKKTATILCLLGFLCVGGIHRIYVGKIISGIIYLLTCGMFFIGTIIDLIQLLTGQFTDNVGQPLRR